MSLKYNLLFMSYCSYASIYLIFLSYINTLKLHCLDQCWNVQFDKNLCKANLVAKVSHIILELEMIMMMSSQCDIFIFGNVTCRQSCNLTDGGGGSH